MHNTPEDLPITLPSWAMLGRVLLLLVLALLLFNPFLSALENKMSPLVWQQTANLQQTFSEFTSQVVLSTLFL